MSSGFGWAARFDIQFGLDARQTGGSVLQITFKYNFLQSITKRNVDLFFFLFFLMIKLLLGTRNIIKQGLY